MAIGALAKQFLANLEIEVLSHVVAVGGIELKEEIAWDKVREVSAKDEVLLSCADPDTEQRMKEEVDKVLRTGDSIGGVFEVVAHNVPPGLGTYVQWDERLDGMLAGAVMSLQAVKAVEIGSGVTAAYSPGSAVHDEIGYGAKEAAKAFGINPQLVEAVVDAVPNAAVAIVTKTVQTAVAVGETSIQPYVVQVRAVKAMASRKPFDELQGADIPLGMRLKAQAAWNQLRTGQSSV